MPEHSEKTLKQELKQRTLELRQTRQDLKQALADCRKVDEIHEQKRLILEAFIASAGGPVFSVDRRYCYTSFNSQHAELMKNLYGGDIEIGHNLLDYHTSPADRLSAKRNMDRALRGETVTVEAYAGEESRSRRYFEIVHAPFRASNGKVVGITVYARDITERKQAEGTLQDSETRYRRLFETAQDGILILDAHTGQINDVNPFLMSMLGYSKESFLGKRLWEIGPFKDIAASRVAFEKLQNQEYIRYEDLPLETSDGCRMDVEFVSNVYDVDHGKVIQCNIRDITIRKQAEIALRESEQHFRLALKHSPVSIATQDRDLRFLWAYNQRTADPNSVIGKSDMDLFSPEDSARLAALKRKVLETGKEISEQIWVNSGGQRLFLDLFIEPLRDASGQVTGIGIATVDLTPMKLAEQAMSQARDELEARVRERTQELVMANEQLRSEIVERERVEAALRESERRYRTLFETSPDAVFMVDVDFKILFANQRAATMHGYRQAKKLLGMNMAGLIASEDRESVHQSVVKILTLGSLREIEYQILMKDGSRYPAELNVTVIHDEQDDPIGYLMDIRDITERKSAEESLRLANAYNRSLIEASLDPLVTITPEGKIGDVNSATEKVTGFTREELIGTDFHNYFSDPEKARLGYQKVFETGTVRDYGLEIRHKDESTTPVLYNASIYRDEAGKVLGVFAVARDITDRKQFETQLIQAEKHAVIGRMVGSITHEINNPLQTIKNCLYLIQQDVTPDSPIHEPLEMMTSETLRLTNLVGQLRELYRPKASLQKHPHEILDILEEAHSLLIPHLNTARVHWQPLTGLQHCYINCVRDQILEVFLNISMNAIDAMQGRGGTLFVNMSVSEKWAAVIFRDTGPGIPKEMMPHLFEPFMTTKTSGLGLGLSIIYGIVQRHGGQIQVDNQPGQGASFTVLLPLKAHAGG